MNIIVCSGAKHIGITPTVELVTKIFTGKETYVRVNGNTNGKDVFVIQSFKDPNNALIELALTINALKLNNTKSITAVIPYFPYARQDKRHDEGTPISARVVCDILKGVGVSRIISFDLHSDQIQGFVGGIPFIHIKMDKFFAKKMKEEFPDFGGDSWKFVAADLGSSKRTSKFAKLFGSTKLCNIIKYRVEDQVVDSMQLTGKINNYHAIIYDDMIDTGGTLGGVYDILRTNEANRILAVATHPVLSDPVKVKKYLDKISIFTTDTNNPDYIPAKTKIFPIKNFLLNILSTINKGNSLDDIYEIG